MTMRRRFVQFPHPGPEGGPERSEWPHGNASHVRKFVCAPGSYRKSISGADEARSRPFVRGEQPARFLVGRAVVHDDDLEVLERLREHAADRLVEVPSEVVARDDDRDSGRVHDIPPAALRAGAGVWTSADRYRATTSCEVCVWPK